MRYSEHQDFIEKEEEITALMSRIANTVGSDMLDYIREGLALELGGSGGILSGILSNYTGRVICSDVMDHHLEYHGQFGKLLQEKFSRNGRHLNLGKIEFQVVDAQKLHFRDNLFDFVFSQNALEHIPDPNLALNEALRVLKPGGILYFTFDPIWTADTGSHFFEYVHEPWLHLLLNDDEYCDRMVRGGAQPCHLKSYVNDMNRLPCSYYRNGIPATLKSSGVKKYKFEEWCGCVDADYPQHPNRTKAAIRLRCNPEDLLVRGFYLVAIK